MIQKIRFLLGEPALRFLTLAVLLPCCVATCATLTNLHTFDGLNDGSYPQANLVRTSQGVLYGTTMLGGKGGWGTVFQLTPNAGGKTYTEKVIYNFTGLADGANPVSDLVLGNSNVLYGTTYGGGKYGYGTVFELLPGATWTEKVLYSFKGGTDGAYPAAGVVWRATSGALYGTTYGGGTAGLGTVYQVIPNGGTGTWNEKVIYSFQGGTDGAYPISDLLLASGSTVTLYGATSAGGSTTIPAGTPPSGTIPGCAANVDNTPCTYENWGTVFQLVGAGGGVFNETQLYSFYGAADGGTPESALIQGPNGVFYGSAFWGGVDFGCATGAYPQGCGVVYQLAPPTSGSGLWTETVLHTFSSTLPEGEHPYGNLARNSTTGVIYGTTYAGGQNVDTCFPAGAYNGCGTIFDLVPPSSPGSPWKKANLIALNGDNGGAPNGVIVTSQGALFGTTGLGGPGLGYGIAFEWSPQ
ncbi:MAG TPA: choice-of-anchor tandem repeat GloVer-containing protein [Bryobacteraceae bacterium]|nr:choice-of-anchor tandem repeat GloVer-containing protein [Bryobacteraceae bacterium]